MNESCSETFRCLTFNAQFLRQLVSNGKTQALDIFYQLVGIIFNDIDSFLFVGILNLNS